MSLAEIKKTIKNRIQELDSRAPLKEYDKGRLFQLEWFLNMIELEEKKQQEAEGKAFTVEELFYLLGLDNRPDLPQTPLEFLEWINNNEGEIKRLLSERGVIGK